MTMPLSPPASSTPNITTLLSHLPAELQDLIFEALKTNHPTASLPPRATSTSTSNADAFFRGALDTAETFSYGDMPKKSRSLLSRPDRYERPAVWFRAPRARKYYLFGFVERLTVAEAPAILRLIEAGRLYAAADMSGPNEPVPDDLGVISRYIFPRLQCFEHGLASLQRMKDNPDFWARLLNKRWLRLWPESAALCYHMPDDFSFELFGHVLCDVSSESEVVVIHGVGLVMFIEGNSVCGTIRRCIADRMVFYLLPEDAAAAESPHTEGISSFLSEWFDETVPENARGSNPQPSEIVFANVSCDEATIKGLLKRQMEKNRLWKAWGGSWSFISGEKSRWYVKSAGKSEERRLDGRKVLVDV